MLETLNVSVSRNLGIRLRAVLILHPASEQDDTTYLTSESIQSLTVLTLPPPLTFHSTCTANIQFNTNRFLFFNE